jgi:predicted nucleic acid-binding protein
VILIDTGPLVALVDRNDQHHAACLAAFKSITQPLGTVWPVVTEAMFLLETLPAGQDAIWQMLERQAVQLMGLDESDVPRLRELMAKYHDQPMDLADAALVRIAEREGVDTVFTVDIGDFQVYRIGQRKTFRVIPGAKGAPRRSRRRH